MSYTLSSKAVMPQGIQDRNRKFFKMFNSFENSVTFQYLKFFEDTVRSTYIHRKKKKWRAVVERDAYVCVYKREKKRERDYSVFKHGTS